jgi:hypothetical protein
MKPGATTGAADVDHAGRGLGDRRRDARDRVARDGEVRAVPRAARAVDDARVAQHEVVRLFGALRRCRNDNARPASLSKVSFILGASSSIRLTSRRRHPDREHALK